VRIDEVLGLPVPGKTTSIRITPPLERPQAHKLLSLADVCPSQNNPEYVTISWKQTAKSVLQQKGLYIWTHPTFGIFYVGIARADNLGQRWDAHTQKLLNRAKVYYPKRWKEFAQIFLAQGVSALDSSQVAKDLEGIKIYFYPINKPGNITDKDYARAIEDLETRIEARWNPRAQGKYNPNFPTVTKNTDNTIPRDPRGMVNLKKK